MVKLSTHYLKKKSKARTQPISSLLFKVINKWWLRVARVVENDPELLILLLPPPGHAEFMPCWGVEPKASLMLGNYSTTESCQLSCPLLILKLAMCPVLTSNPQSSRLNLLKVKIIKMHHKFQHSVHTFWPVYSGHLIDGHVLEAPQIPCSLERTHQGELLLLLLLLFLFCFVLIFFSLSVPWFPSK